MARHFFAITLFLIGLAISPAAKANDFTDHFVATDPPKNVPSFTFEGNKGQVLDIKNFRGKYILLNLWATWCMPCVREMPSLDVLAQKLATDLDAAPTAGPVTISTRQTIMAAATIPRIVIIPIAEDNDGRDAAEGFYKRHNLNHLKVYADPTGQVPSFLHINGLPTTILINPLGKEIGRIEGATDWSDAGTVAFLEKQIKPDVK